MKQKMYPIIISTMDALRLSIQEEYSVIFVDRHLFSRQQEKIQKLMESHGYTVPKKEGKTGMFFVRETGRFAFDPQLHDIYDPYNIL